MVGGFSAAAAAAVTADVEGSKQLVFPHLALAVTGQQLQFIVANEAADNALVKTPARLHVRGPHQLFGQGLGVQRGAPRGEEGLVH